jgi:hypothetical protein
MPRTYAARTFLRQTPNRSQSTLAHQMGECR